MAVKIIQGTDKTFNLNVVKSSGGFKELTDANLVLSLKIQGDNADLEITEVANPNASVISVSEAYAGKIAVVLGDADTALLKDGTIDMELSIQEGAGPDYAKSKVQFVGALEVSKSLFD